MDELLFPRDHPAGRLPSVFVPFHSVLLLSAWPGLGHICACSIAREEDGAFFKDVTWECYTYIPLFRAWSHGLRRAQEM